MPESLVGLGGNTGDVRPTLRGALAALADGDGVTLTSRSSDYRTPAWGLRNQPDFINLCVAVETSLTPRQLLERALDVERRFGRDRSSEQVWGPRSVDIDILTYDDVRVNDPWLTLPHPQLLRRAFVLVPLVEIRPLAVIGGVRAATALAELDATGIVRLPPET